jgi:TAT (twin-arginine translocation) pathway signal sequence
MEIENYSMNRRGFLKGLAVGAGGCVLGASLIYPQEVTGQSPQNCLDKVPMETRWSIDILVSQLFKRDLRHKRTRAIP